MEKININAIVLNHFVTYFLESKQDFCLQATLQKLYQVNVLI